jgi:hypothetical protein
LALAAFFIKFLVEANPKGWRREPADKMCLSEGENFYERFLEYQKISFSADNLSWRLYV